ncbi:MAG: G-D-S-L family lipolytic protein [Chitinophagaceae bacterium]|nr:G-D-S-L family lipolytic protein [Chitinophagaceae bacterium]
MSVLKKIVFLFFAAIIVITSNAQQEPYPFWNDIQSFKQKDSVQAPPANAILFVGSSSFTMWKDVQDYFPGYTIINRGFGGSTLPDVIRYANEVIYPYKPKQVVIYCGENDLASSDSITARDVFERFKILYAMIRNQFKNIPIAYISMKPSPSRQKFFPKMIAGNNMIKDFLKKKKHSAFIDVYSKMLNSDGKPMDDIFLDDKLHMNKKGYAIWQKEIQPFLIKE